MKRKLSSAGFWKQRIARCRVDYFSHVVKSIDRKSEDLASDPASVTYSLGNLFSPGFSIFTHKMNIQLEDHKVFFTSKSGEWHSMSRKPGDQHRSLSLLLSMAHMLLHNKALCISENSHSIKGVFVLMVFLNSVVFTTLLGEHLVNIY